MVPDEQAIAPARSTDVQRQQRNLAATVEVLSPTLGDQFEDGFICNVEMVRSDGTNEVIYLRRSGPLAPGDEIPLSPP